MRNKKKDVLQLKGENIILKEITPVFFQHVIKWRNNPELNQFLNQPYVLTQAKEDAWYKNVYLNDNTQGLMIMVDAKTEIAFGTCGWTNLDVKEKRCISGRILRGDDSYKGTPAFYEAFIVLADYLYQFVEVMYAHVVKENIPSLRLHEWMGYSRCLHFFQYPQERYSNGVEQIELYRKKKQYLHFRDKMIQRIL